MSEVVGEELPQALLAVLSGPSFAAEVARELPTAVTLACADRKLQRTLPAALGTKYFRIYSTDDVIGVEIGGAVKNVLAIACGIVAGRGLGDNSRAALITRGLAEMARLAIVKGARAETLMGLAGVGDLVLTCNALQSRNYSLGVALGEGATLETVLSQRTSVAEGVFTSASVTALAHRLDVDMPICFAVDQVLNQNADLDTIIDGLLSRPFRSEDLAGSSIEKL
jgi:glycerol-3-phosphate dehydrogenase (NAD(P)+)